VKDKKMRISGGELSRKALSDTTKYKALEVGHWMAEDIEPHLYQAIANYENMIDENEFCVVMVLATDPLIKNLIRRKFYCWPYLPSPRPNQSVFLYNKSAGRIIKRLWVLPSALAMSDLTDPRLTVNKMVHKRYETMQAWSMAFFEGKFWEYIRYESEINMPSEHEYFLQHREELIQAGCKLPTSDITEAFDFDKIQIKQVIDTKEALIE
jgi:hypothetical protein